MCRYCTFRILNSHFKKMEKSHIISFHSQQCTTLTTLSIKISTLSWNLNKMWQMWKGSRGMSTLAVLKLLFWFQLVDETGNYHQFYDHIHLLLLLLAEQISLITKRWKAQALSLFRPVDWCILIHIDLTTFEDQRKKSVSVLNMQRMLQCVSCM